MKINVLYPEKGVCADPVDKGPSSDRGRQLATDIAGEKTWLTVKMREQVGSEEDDPITAQKHLHAQSEC